MAIVETKDVTRVYTSGNHELKALNGINFTLDEGKFVVILSPSGAGKSTLLNMLDSPTSGIITVNGKDISTLSNNELADYRASTIGWSLFVSWMVARKNKKINMVEALKGAER